MKKLLFSAALALLACGLSATPSFAHAFGLFTCHKCCGKCCSMKICCRQYNAFTPFCCGNICCNGCCPFGGGYGGGPGPGCGEGPGCGPMACGPDGCYGGDGLPAGALPSAPATGPALPSKPLPSGATSMYQPAAGYGAVQSASYYPGYASRGYAPAYNYGYPGAYGPASGYGPMVAPAFNPLAVPAYWNSDR